MGVFPDTQPGDEYVRAVVVRRTPAASVDQLAWALRAARSWLGDESASPRAGLRRYAADLRLRVGERPALVAVRKSAFVDVGPIEPRNDGWEAEIGWRAATLAPLFPVFSGRLVARPDELVLSGWYAPPGGAAGRAADAAVLHIAAGATARWLLGALDEAAQRQGTLGGT